jgi:hypothetical protein
MTKILKHTTSTVYVLFLGTGFALAEDQFFADVPHLTEQAATAGLDHVFGGPWEYFVGGGAASFDCNGDRMPDLLVAGGENPASLFVNQSMAGGELRFTKQPLLLSEKDLTKVTGAYPVNFNNDPHMDVILLRLGQNIALQGQGDCQFTKANEALSLDGGDDWTTGFSAIWEADSTYPTLAFGNYIDRSLPGSPWGTCHDNVLARPAFDDGELPNYTNPTVLSPGYCSLSMMFTDWNNSGEPALRITNDRQYYRGGQEQLWQVSPGQAPRSYGPSDGWQQLTIWGMGIAAADLNGDGAPEYALTSMGDTMLQTLDDEAEEDQPAYRDIAYESGTTAHRPYVGDNIKPSTGWHSQFADVNNDGLSDLFIAKGNVEAMPDFAAFDPDNLLLGKRDGRFSEQGEAAGIALDTKGRGGVVEDFNADGMLDILVVNREQNVTLFRNQGAKTGFGHRPMGNWIKIELQNGATNPQTVGALIQVKTGNHTQTHRVQIGGGHASGQSGFAHFGLGVAERASIRIQWPNGDWSQPYRAFANNHVIIPNGAIEPLYWYPPQ